MPFEVLMINEEATDYMNRDYLIQILKDNRFISKMIDRICDEKGWNKEEANELIATGDLDEDFWINECINWAVETKMVETLMYNLKMYYKVITIGNI